MLRQIICCCTVAATVMSLNGCGAATTPDRPPSPTPAVPLPTPAVPSPTPAVPSPTPAVPTPTPAAPSPTPPRPTPAVPSSTPDSPKPTPKPAPPPTSSTTTKTTTTTRGGGECTSPFWNDTHSCFAGVVVDAKTDIICGANKWDGAPAIYPRATTSCGGQFNHFNPKEMFFCYTNNYSYSVGKCAPWKADFDTSCTCPQPRMSELVPVPSEESMVNGWAPTVDTRKRPSAKDEPTGPCWTPTADYGCMNGHRYNYGTQLPCGNWLADPRTHGCCPTTGEFSPYNVETESCCNGDDGQYEVKPGGHACQCTTCGSTITV